MSIDQYDIDKAIERHFYDFTAPRLRELERQKDNLASEVQELSEEIRQLKRDLAHKDYSND